MDDGSLLIAIALGLLILLNLFIPFNDNIFRHRAEKRDLLIRLNKELERIEKKVNKLKGKLSQSEKTAIIKNIIDYYLRLEEKLRLAVKYHQKLCYNITNGESLYTIPPQMTGNNPDDIIEEIIAAYRRKKEEKASGFCFKCGSPIFKGDKYCWSCGEKLE